MDKRGAKLGLGANRGSGRGWHHCWSWIWLGWGNVCIMGGLCRFWSTSCRSTAMAAPLAGRGLLRCKAVLHGYRTSPLEGFVLMCDSAHSCWLYSAALLEHQAAGTMTCDPTQWYYPDTERTSPRPILIMWSTRLVGDKYTFLSHWFDSTRIRKREERIRTKDFQISRSPRMGGGHSYSFGHPDWSFGWDNRCSITQWPERGGWRMARGFWIIILG